MRLVAVLALAAVVTAGCGTAHAPEAAAPRQPTASANSAPEAQPSAAPAVPSGAGQLGLDSQTTAAGGSRTWSEVISASLTADGAVQWTWTEGGALRPATETYRTVDGGFEVRTTSGTWEPTKTPRGVGLTIQNLWGSSRPGDVLPDLIAATVDWQPTDTGWAGRITADSSVESIVRTSQRLSERYGQPWTERDAQVVAKSQRNAVWPRLTGGQDLAVTWTQSDGGAVEFSVTGGSVHITGSWTPIQ